MTASKEIIDKLLQEPDQVRERKTDFGAVRYLETWVVIDQLNETFGYDGWSFDIARLEMDDSQTFYLCHGILSIKPLVVTRSDVGISAINRRQDGRISPDAYDTAAKSAVSDCLKRCARTLGKRFGNELYEKEKKDDEEPRPRRDNEGQTARTRTVPKKDGVKTKANGETVAPAAPRLAPEPPKEAEEKKTEVCAVCKIDLTVQPHVGWVRRKRATDPNFPSLCVKHYKTKVT